MFVFSQRVSILSTNQKRRKGCSLLYWHSNGSASSLKKGYNEYFHISWDRIQETKIKVSWPSELLIKKKRYHCQSNVYVRFDRVGHEEIALPITLY